MEKHQKLILQKLSVVTFNTDERDVIDIFQDLPLKDQNDLAAMETKLNNDSIYRKHMVSCIPAFNFIVLEYLL